jgi:hypothetical protein
LCDLDIRKARFAGSSTKHIVACDDSQRVVIIESSYTSPFENKLGHIALIKNLKFLYSTKSYDKLDFDRKISEVSYKPKKPYQIPEKFEQLRKWSHEHPEMRSKADHVMNQLDSGGEARVFPEGGSEDSQGYFSSPFSDSQAPHFLFDSHVPE